jgi:hypothetical protein
MLRLDLYIGFIIKKTANLYQREKGFYFLKNNKSPFYNIKTGKVSGYNEVGQVMFKTLVEGHENIEERFKKNITKTLVQEVYIGRTLILGLNIEKLKIGEVLLKDLGYTKILLKQLKILRLKRNLQVVLR